MNILIVSEKPSLSHSIAPVARAHWPADNITFVHAVPYGNFRFVYPRGLRMQDFPHVSEPVHGLVSWANWSCKPLVLDAQGTLAVTSMGPEHFTSADLIIYACDPDHTGAMAFEVLMAVVFGDERARHCPALKLFALDEVSILRAFAEMQPFGPAFKHALDFGEVKRYFDWNWYVNGFAVLGDVVRRAGVPSEAAALSKYALQLLYALRDKEPMSEGSMVQLMRNWSGTGRYTYKKGEWRPRMGSVASVGKIIENLIGAGLLTQFEVAYMGPLREFEHPPTVLTLSDRGRALLELLHPDCEDSDLPFRLDAWCNQGAAAKPAIDRYIKTFFGKQLRFAGVARA